MRKRKLVTFVEDEKLSDKLAAKTGAVRKKPPILFKPPLEKDIQKAIIRLIEYACPSVLAFAVPNAAIRAPGHHAGNAIPGLRKGVFDICLLGPGQRVYFLEVKRPGTGKVSEDQEKFGSSLRARDIPYAIVTSVEEAKEFLESQNLILKVRFSGEQNAG